VTLEAGTLGTRNYGWLSHQLGGLDAVDLFSEDLKWPQFIYFSSENFSPPKSEPRNKTRITHAKIQQSQLRKKKIFLRWNVHSLKVNNNKRTKRGAII
jgi:hypothetical protein